MYGLKAVIRDRIDEPLMLQVNLPVVNTIHPQMTKAIGGSKLNDCPEPNGNICNSDKWVCD